MSQYLAKAADLIAQTAAQTSGYSNEQLKCARAYALLAAIDKGLLPEPLAAEIYGQFKHATS